MNKIQSFLIEIGVSVSNRGFDYLYEGIKILQNDSSYKNNIIELYNKIGKNFDERYTNVERCIRYSIKKCFSNADKGKLSEIFGEVNVKRSKITNSEFMSICALYLQE